MFGISIGPSANGLLDTVATPTEVGKYRSKYDMIFAIPFGLCYSLVGIRHDGCTPFAFVVQLPDRASSMRKRRFSVIPMAVSFSEPHAWRRFLIQIKTPNAVAVSGF